MTIHFCTIFVSQLFHRIGDNDFLKGVLVFCKYHHYHLHIYIQQNENSIIIIIFLIIIMVIIIIIIIVFSNQFHEGQKYRW